MLDSSQSGATAGTPAFFYVYILRSISHPEQIYTGFTESIPGRLSITTSGDRARTRSDIAPGNWKRTLRSRTDSWRLISSDT